MAQPNFGSILDKAPSDVKAPEALPVGSYLCTVMGLPRYDKSTKKGTEFVEYNLVIQDVGEDVDEEDAKAVDGGLRGKSIKATYYLTDTALYRLKEFLEHCGLDVEHAESMRELVDQAQGQQVIAYLKHEAATDGSDRVFARLAGTAPVES